jgi:pimeloyl-ACP methyl ester carboxylesterase
VSAISLARWKSEGETFTFKRRRIFYRVGGDAAAAQLVLIHGFPTSAWDWEALWAPLTSRYRVAACDLLGFGLSDKPSPHAYSIFEQADVVEALFREVGFDRVHVLAHDYGVTVAQEMLARDRAQAKLESVCFLNGGLFPETHRARFVQKLLASPLGPTLARLYRRSMFDRAMIGIFGPRTPPSVEKLAGDWELFEHNNGRHAMPGLIRYMHERRVHRERWVPALVDAKCPLRLINGALDPVSGAHLAARYREVVPNADVAMLDDIGHYPQVEAPKRVVDHYFAFRDRIAVLRASAGHDHDHQKKR